jgi:hypothetical protein
MDNQIKKSNYALLAFLLIGLLNACSSSTESELSSEDKQIISDWESNCSSEPTSEICSNLVLKYQVLNFASPYVSDYRPALMADFKSNSKNASLGYLTCDKSSGFCEAELKVQNISSSAFDQSLSAIIIGNGGRFSATEEVFLDKPLNPRLFAYPEFYFNMGYLSEELKTLRISGWSNQQAEILLCKNNENAKTVSYGNCLRLDGWKLVDEEFVHQKTK